MNLTRFFGFGCTAIVKRQLTTSERVTSPNAREEAGAADRA
ncbi:MAG: hypothetical protein AB1645_04045 [Bacillota bacterium]|jgi:hypothetical protein